MEVEGLNEWDRHPLICTYINSTFHQSIDRNIILSKLDIHRVKENPRTGKNFQAERWGFREQEDDDDDALLSSSSFPVRLEPIRDWHRLKKKVTRRLRLRRRRCRLSLRRFLSKQIWLESTTFVRHLNVGPERWSVCSPYTPTIWVLIPLKSTFFIP